MLYRIPEEYRDDISRVGTTPDLLSLKLKNS